MLLQIPMGKVTSPLCFPALGALPGGLKQHFPGQENPVGSSRGRRTLRPGLEGNRQKQPGKKALWGLLPTGRILQTPLHPTRTPVRAQAKQHKQHICSLSESTQAPTRSRSAETRVTGDRTRGVPKCCRPSKIPGTFAQIWKGEPQL